MVLTFPATVAQGAAGFAREAIAGPIASIRWSLGHRFGEMIRHPSCDDNASFAVGLTADDLAVLSRLIIKAMLDDPVEYRLLD